MTRWHCSACGRLHTRDAVTGAIGCELPCCASAREVPVRMCADCWGRGEVTEQIDEERPAIRFGCSTCRGNGVVAA